MLFYVQAFLDGLLLGGVYACVAVGLSLSYGVMRVMNWAAGEMLMISMFVGAILVRDFGFDPYLTMLVTIPLMFILGFLLQKFGINPLLMREKSREPLSVMIFTAGIGIVVVALASMLFSTVPISVNTVYAGVSMKLGNIIISQTRLIAFIISIVSTAALFVFMRFTETGRALRAASQDRVVAQLMGMNIRFLYCLAFGISFVFTAIASGIMVPLYAVSTTSVSGTFGFIALVIVVLGGRGSVWGTFVAALLVGVIEKFGATVMPDIYAQALIFVIFVLVLLFKPAGLFSKERGD